MAIGVVLAAAACARRAAPAYELCVATWNLRWFPTGRPEPVPEEVERHAIAAAAREVRRLEPHILCLQEIRDHAAAAALAERSRLPGFRVVVCSAFTPPEGSPGSQQVAILSNLPVIEAGAARWRVVGPVDPPRGYAYAVLSTPVGPVAVFSVHLKSNFIAPTADREHHVTLNRLKREQAAAQLRDVVRHMLARRDLPGLRIVVAGDFNTSRHDPRWAGETTLQGLTDDGLACVFEGLPPHTTHTLPASPFHPAVTFDYVFHRGFGAPRDVRVHPKHWVSDHRMVSARLAPASAPSSAPSDGLNRPPRPGRTLPQFGASDP